MNIEQKTITALNPQKLSDLGVKERFDLEEWIEKTPDILGEELLIISKELTLQVNIRLDLLAVDKEGNIVIIELKRDDSGSDIEWQAIKYASYCSYFVKEDILKYYSEYKNLSVEEAGQKIEEFVGDLDILNQYQRIILVSREFNPAVASAVLWLRDYDIDIICVRLQSFRDEDGGIFITPDTIIPLPETEDIIYKKGLKQKEEKKTIHSSFSLEIGTFDQETLEKKLRETLELNSVLIPRFVCFIDILLSDDRVFKRDEIKQKLYDNKVGADIGQTGTYLSNLSQFLTKSSNSHLRQVIEFNTGGGLGETKDDYRIVPQYRELLLKLVTEYKTKHVNN